MSHREVDRKHVICKDFRKYPNASLQLLVEGLEVVLVQLEAANESELGHLNTSVEKVLVIVVYAT